MVGIPGNVFHIGTPDTGAAVTVSEDPIIVDGLVVSSAIGFAATTTFTTAEDTPTTLFTIDTNGDRVEIPWKWVADKGLRFTSTDQSGFETTVVMVTHHHPGR